MTRKRVCTKNMPVLANTPGVAISVLVCLLLLTKLICSNSSSHPSDSITPRAALLYPRLTINNQTESEGGMHWSRRSRDTSSSAATLVYPHHYSGTSSSHFENGWSTINYPFITTVRPRRRITGGHIKYYQHRPQMTKISVRPIKRLPVDDYTSEEIDESSFEQDFVPMAPFYTSDSGRLTILPASSQLSSYPIESVVKAAAVPSFSSSAMGIAYSGVSSPDWSSSQSHEANSHHVVPIAIAPMKKEPKWDLKKLGILALFKIGLAKLKAFGILKVLFFILLKFKLALVLLFVKFVLFLKALKLLKALLLPFFLIALLPLLLLLLPLLFLPLLLPLLLLLPVQVPTAVRDQHARIQMLDYVKTHKSDVVMEILSQLLDSEKCVERIACELATKKESKLLFPIMKWYISKLGNTIRNERISSYVHAYLRTVKEYDGPFGERDGHQWCVRKFNCDQNAELSDPTAAAVAVAASAAGASPDHRRLETETTTTTSGQDSSI